MRIDDTLDKIIFGAIVFSFAALVMTLIIMTVKYEKQRRDIQLLEMSLQEMHVRLLSMEDNSAPATLVDDEPTGKHRDNTQDVGAVAEELLVELWRRFPDFQFQIGATFVKVLVPHDVLVEIDETDILRGLQFYRVHYQQYVYETYFRDDEIEGVRAYTFALQQVQEPAL